ncbi:MAG: hypothetical protein ABIG03_04995 [Candidatus Eisenbacteria bacterium]
MTMLNMMARRRLVHAALTIATVSAVVLTCMALCGCGPRGGISDRYVAEKLAWQARKLERAMAENPELATDEMRQRLGSTYGEIVRSFPPPTGDPSSMTDVELDVARLSGMSRLRLAGLAARAGDAAEAQRFLRSVCDSYAFSRPLAVEAATQLASSHAAAGEPSRAAAVLDELAGAWPPSESRDGMPDPRVLRAPLMAAGHRVGAGLEGPGDALERARTYYRRVLADWSGTHTGRAALATIAESYELEGRWSDAVLAYERLDGEYERSETQASLWIKLAELYAGRMGDSERALECYRAVEDTYGDAFDGGSASIALARYDLGAGRYDRGRERLESILSRFADEEALAATAAHLLALSYESEGRIDSAISRYGDLSAAYPTTLYGLQAPLHVSDLYAAMGEDAAASAALDRAVDQYQRIIRDYTDTPAELAARNHLITARSAQKDWSGVADLLFETAARHPEVEAAPMMMLQAAELYETRLANPGAARDVLKALVNAFGGSDAAAEAAVRLERME